MRPTNVNRNTMDSEFAFQTSSPISLPPRSPKKMERVPSFDQFLESAESGSRYSSDSEDGALTDPRVSKASWQAFQRSTSLEKRRPAYLDRVTLPSPAPSSRLQRSLQSIQDSGDANLPRTRSGGNSQSPFAAFDLPEQPPACEQRMLRQTSSFRSSTSSGSSESGAAPLKAPALRSGSLPGLKAQLNRVSAAGRMESFRSDSDEDIRTPGTQHRGHSTEGPSLQRNSLPAVSLKRSSYNRRAVQLPSIESPLANPHASSLQASWDSCCVQEAEAPAYPFQPTFASRTSAVDARVLNDASPFSKPSDGMIPGVAPASFPRRGSLTDEQGRMLPLKSRRALREQARTHVVTSKKGLQRVRAMNQQYWVDPEEMVSTRVAVGDCGAPEAAPPTPKYFSAEYTSQESDGQSMQRNARTPAVGSRSSLGKRLMSKLRDHSTLQRVIVAT